MRTEPAPTANDATRRAGVRRTVWLFAGIAVLVYAAFLWTGMRG